MSEPEYAFLSFFKICFYFMCLCESLCAYMCNPMGVLCQQRSKERPGTPRTGITGSAETCSVGVGSEPRSSAKATALLTTELTLQHHFLTWWKFYYLHTTLKIIFNSTTLQLKHCYSMKDFGMFK